MIDWLFQGSFAADAVWQSTLWLACGWVGARLLDRRPAQAHGFLALCMLAAVASPVASFAVRHFDLGWFAAPAARAASPAALPTELADPLTDTSLSGETVFVLAWSAVSSLLALRLVWMAYRSRRWLREVERASRPTAEPALLSAARRLGLDRCCARVRVAPGVETPVIWCWGRSPLVFLPDRELPESDRERVLCHELAHCKRKDHWFDAAASVFLALFFWQPLAWLAARRLAVASERACDRWVLATGAAPVDYAETLLSLVPQRLPARVLGAVSRESVFVGRVRDILHADAAPPRIGRVRASLAGVMVAAAATTLAFAQERRPVAPPSETTLPVALVATDSSTPVTIAPRELDLGSTTPGVARSATVRLVHRGTEPRLVEKVATTCGCTTATPDVEGRVLQPGETIELVITMKPSDVVGELKTKDVVLAVEGQDPIRLPVRLRTVRPE